MKTTLRHRVFSLIAVLLIALSTSVTAQNNGPFVKVEQPSAAGIEWVAGNSYLISWTDNLTKPVLIELVNYGATPVTYEVINPSAEGSTWVWPIPAGIAPGNQYKIKIFSTVNNAIVDWSDEFFSIVASATGSYIKVEQPSLPNIKWVRGTTNVISWDDNMPGKVKVELVNDALTAYDNASYTGYAGGLWGTGTNGGYGFEPWVATYSGTTSGVVGNPSDIGIIGMDNPSFWLSSGDVGSITTDRQFSAALQVGSIFSFDWAVNYGNGNAFGSKGIKLYTGGTGGAEIIHIKMEFNPDIITINGLPMFVEPGLHVMNIKFKYISLGNLQVTGIGRDGSEEFDQTISVSSAPDAIRFYTENNSSSNNDLRRIYFNNLKITTPDKLLADNVEGTTHYWPITNAYAFGDKYKIRVTSKDNPLINDISDNYFAITATEGGALELLQPNSPSPVITWVKGSTYLISWNGNGYFPVKVELLKSGTPVATIGGSVSGTTTTWQVPGSTVSGDDYKIKVTRIADGVSVTGAAFSIQNNAPGGFVTVEQPSEAGIEWIRGTSHLISWNTNISGSVNIELANYGVTPNTFNTIASNVVGSTWVWNIPANTPLGSKFRIIVWANNNTVFGASSEFFKIVDYPSGGTITVLQPSVSNITWLRGSQNLISWNPTIPGPFNIELYCPTCTPAYHMIKTGVVGSTWVWDIPELTYPVGAGYKIKVWSSDNASVSGVSEHPFDLADTPPGGIIEVLQPNGGEFLYKEVPYLISWIDDIPEAVNLKLLRYNSSHVLQGESIIANNVEGTTHIWNIPGTVIPSDYYKVKVMSSLGSSTVYDLSDDYFSIQLQPLTVSVYPNPAKNYVNVKFAEKADESYTVQLKDRFNMTLSNVVVNAAYDKEIQISTAQLPNGVYFLTIVSDKTKTTEKIVVQH